MANLKKVPEDTIQDIKVSGVESKTVNQDEYSAEIIRDYYGAIDPFYLSKKDSEFEYRFLRDDPKNLSMKRGNLLFMKGGWQIAPKSHLKRIGIKDEEIAPDGTLRRGDTILAFMPKKLYEEKHKYKMEKSAAPMKAVRRKISKGDPSAGAGIHETMTGLQTGKQLGMK